MPTRDTKCRQLLVVWISRPCKVKAAVTEGRGATGPAGRTPAGHQDSQAGGKGERASLKLALPNLLCDLGLAAVPLWALPPLPPRAEGRRLLTSELSDSQQLS